MGAAEFCTSLTEGFVGESKEKGVAIVKTGSDKAVNKNGSSVFSEGGTETINVTKIKICRPGKVTDVGLE